MRRPTSWSGPQLLTASRGKAARACRRQHLYRYGQGYRAKRAAWALAFGTLIHKALEAWWRATQRGELASRLEQALGVVEAEVARMHPLGGWEAWEALAKARAMVAGYDARWGAEAFTVVGVELQFRGPLVNPDTAAHSRTWRLAGKLDVLVVDGQGRLLVVEHKTTTEGIEEGSVYWRKLRLDSQISIYFQGGQLLAGRPVDACLYDVLRVPGQEPLKATPVEARKYTKDGRLYASQRGGDETPEAFEARVLEAVANELPRYFARGEVVRLEEEKADGMRDLWALVQSLNEEAREGRAPRTPEACFTYGRACDFWEVCTGEASLNDSTRYEVGPQHPELEPEPGDPAAPGGT